MLIKYVVGTRLIFQMAFLEHQELR